LLVVAEAAALEAIEFHLLDENVISVFESAQLEDRITYTGETSLLSLEPRHDAADWRNLPPLVQTQPLNFGTVEWSQAEEFAAA
jgi:hypothetical protein